MLTRITPRTTPRITPRIAPTITGWGTAVLGSLLPTIAWAHGGHGELGDSHLLWHVLPLLAVSVLAGGLVFRDHRVRQRARHR